MLITGQVIICSVLQNSHVVLYSQASHRRSSGLFSGSARAWPQIKSSDSFQYSICFSNLLEYKNSLRQWFSHLSVCKNITLLAKVSVVKAMVFLVVMYRCESWIIKKAEHWRIDAFELSVLNKTFESCLDCKEIKPVNPKGNQPWIFIGRSDAEAEASLFRPPEVKSLLIGKDPDAGKDWR